MIQVIMISQRVECPDWLNDAPATENAPRLELDSAKDVLKSRHATSPT
jgi:hypothetical protein